jgi:hypothetical protein
MCQAPWHSGSWLVMAWQSSCYSSRVTAENSGVGRYRSSGAKWASVVGLCAVALSACLNPIPDDFPNGDDRHFDSDTGSSPEEGAAGTPSPDPVRPAPSGPSDPAAGGAPDDGAAESEPPPSAAPLDGPDAGAPDGGVSGGSLRGR